MLMYELSGLLLLCTRVIYLSLLTPVNSFTREELQLKYFISNDKGGGGGAPGVSACDTKACRT